jgi:hypothetical protein
VKTRLRSKKTPRATARQARSKRKASATLDPKDLNLDLGPIGKLH